MVSECGGKFSPHSMVLYTDHEYDSSDRIKSQSWQMGSEAFEEVYTYNSADGTLGSMTVDGEELSFGYDYLKRLDKKTLTHVNGSARTAVLDVSYVYRNLAGTDRTTTQVQSVQYLIPGTTTPVLPKHTYSYDARGNIEKVEVTGRDAVEYKYDKQNQLVEEKEGTLLNTYSYDTYGNIRSITTAQLGTGMQKNYAFTYNDSGAWKDQLTKVTYTGYNGTVKSGNITYDEIGNPLTYFNGHKTWNFTWKYGRQLASATDGTNTITNTYDIDGIRQTKTVNGVEHKYVTLDGKIIRETYGNVKVDYFYDNDGSPLKIEVNNNGTTYTGYYVLNQQGDVIGIIDAEGNVLVRYYYNAWGLEVAEYTGARSADHPLRQYNALKYRGYYYDAESGFYYVSSRYYDPVIGRFISADSAISGVGGDIRGYNMYSYCFNNPVNMSDPTGDWPKWVETAAKVVSVAVAVTAVVVMATTVAGVVAGTIATAAAGKAVLGATVLIGAALSGINGGIANERKGNSYANGYAGGFVGGGVQAYMSKNKGGTIYGGGIGVTIGTAVTDVLNNVDPDSANSSASQIAKNAATSGLKALATSSLTALVGSGVGGVNYKTGVIEGAVLDGCGGLMPSLTLGFGEGIKALFGWADDAVIYLWE